MSCSALVLQTLKDVSRERFHVNKAPTDPSNCWSHIRALLLRAALDNLQQPTDRTARPADAAAQQTGTGGGGIVADPTAPASASATVAEEIKPLRDTDQRSRLSTGAGAGTDTLPSDPAAAAAGAAGGNAVLPGGTDGTGGYVDGASAREEGGGGKNRRGVANGDHTSDTAIEGGVPKSPLGLYVDQCAWRVLHAASRTASGGDSFFVVQVQ